jgi:hypothetical protein
MKEQFGNQYLERYINGNHHEVWAELIDLGDLVRHVPLASQAMQVADETMHRVRKNLEVLIERLHEIGYHFEYPESVLTDPEPDCEERIAKLENSLGVIPLSLHAWYKNVGSTCFIGSHPEWRECFDGDFLHDPIVVFSLSDVMEEYENWLAVQVRLKDLANQFEIPIAPDIYHKSDISGGPPFSMCVPDAFIDGTLLNEPHNTTFVAYLRLSFSWGGFPGFEKTPRPPIQHLQYLSEGLLSF